MTVTYLGRRMKSVYKFYINPEAYVQTYLMPPHSIILNAGLDAQNKTCFWALVDKDIPADDYRPYYFWCVGTGWDLSDMDEYVDYVGSVKEGSYMWHIFYKGDDHEVLRELDEYLDGLVE